MWVLLEGTVAVVSAGKLRRLQTVFSVGPHYVYLPRYACEDELKKVAFHLRLGSIAGPAKCVYRLSSSAWLPACLFDIAV